MSTAHTHPFNGPFSGTTQVSRYQKGKTNLDFIEARDSEWQCHQLGHMQVCISLQTDNHTSTQPLSFLQAGCHSCRPTNSVKALKAVQDVCSIARNSIPIVIPKHLSLFPGSAIPGSDTRHRLPFPRRPLIKPRPPIDRPAGVALSVAVCLSSSRLSSLLCAVQYYNCPVRPSLQLFHQYSRP